MNLIPYGPPLTSLLRDYSAAMKPYREAGANVIEFDDFFRRLQLCRRCPRGWWSESLSDGYGRCADVRRSCAIVRLWLKSQRCGLTEPAW